MEYALFLLMFDPPYFMFLFLTAVAGKIDVKCKGKM